ncbi:MAG: hypothetical protein AB2687_13660 [Candidatus Thiodiazotropha taylori]
MSKKMKSIQGIYVVMADNGVGEFLWLKDNDDPIPVCGSNVYSLMDKKDLNPIMSGELFSEFCKWAEDFKNNVPVLEEAVSFDWEAFNKRGIELAKTLKSEWGDEITVRYVRPSQDPDRKKLEYIEVK